MPQVQEELKKPFPQCELQIFKPEQAIAIGASIYAQFCDGKDTFLSDIAAFSYGTTCFKANTEEYILWNLIMKGDRLPKKVKRNFTQHKDGKKSVFNIYETNTSDEKMPKDEAENYIMSVIIEYDQVVKKGEPIKLELTLTPDGLIEALAEGKDGKIIKAKKQLNF